MTTHLGPLNFDEHGSPPLVVLMVAEKPSIAQALARALAPKGGANKRKGKSPSSPVHEYEGLFYGVIFFSSFPSLLFVYSHSLLQVPAFFKVTATTGHMYSLDFPDEYNQNRETVKPHDLFGAPVVHLEAWRQ